MDLGITLTPVPNTPDADGLTVKYKVGPEDFVAYGMHTWEQSLEGSPYPRTPSRPNCRGRAVGC